MRPLKAIFITFILCAASTVQANAQKGFHQGPYISLGAGVMKFDWDVNQRTLVEEGNTREPVFALLHGWNIKDWFGVELLLRYATSQNNGRREHIGGIHVGPAFFPIFGPLVRPARWKFLPFVKAAFIVQIAALPGDTNSSDRRVINTGVGTGFGGGLRVLYNKYLYFGFEGNQEFLRHQNTRQNLSPGGDTLIYAGGWKKQFNLLGTVGVHF